MTRRAGCLYVIDFPNGKSYYGITSRGLTRRLQEHRALATKGAVYALSKALRLYDDWFLAKVLLIAPMDYLQDLEILVIKQFNSRIPNGYNQAFGGKLAPSLTPEARLVLSSQKLGTHHRDETKAKLRKAWETRPRNYTWSDAERSKRALKPHSRAMLGKHHSPEVIAKIRQASIEMWQKRKGIKNA